MLLVPSWGVLSLARGASTKKAVDIERLLRWAYLDELSKRHSSPAENIWRHMGSTSSAPSAPHYDFGTPHPDALKIEACVLLLEPLKPEDWGTFGPALMGDIWGLFQARDVIIVRSLNTAFLIRHHAILGSRPHWNPAKPHPYRVLATHGPRGNAKVEGKCWGQNRYSPGAYCPLRWSPSPITIAQERLDYAAWHLGLVTLAQTLALEEHDVLLPAAPARPWDGEQERKGTLWPPYWTPPQRPLPLRQPGPLAGPPAPKPRPSRGRIIEPE
jgi:hypothetical protein